MKFYTKSYLRNLSESNLEKGRTFSSFINESRKEQKFDVFLSHSYKDKQYIKGLFIDLTNKGYSVYVDWIIDPHLSRSYVTKDTVNQIRKRMSQSKSLIYATSENASNSKWMPWELGFMDGHTNQCAILPITDYESSSFKGQEFLSAYPYIGKEYIAGAREKGEVLWVNESSNKYIKMDLWQKGFKPTFH